jgi:hypothetical protein
LNKAHIFGYYSKTKKENMRKITMTLFAAGFLAASLMSCGDKYTPLTEEQKTFKADSIFNATAEQLKAEKMASCDADFQAKVDAKVQELQAAATASN